jgi:glycosyltransferase involved in cell wall biosynthesis
VTLDISAAVITKNEEDNIRDCLSSLAWTREIVVLDSGSLDDTLKIAREFTDKVFVEEWRGYTEQKNAAVDHCSGRWVLSLDADERVSEELRREIEERLSVEDGGLPDGFLIPRLSFYLGRWVRRGGWYPDRKLRLFRKGRGRWSGNGLHEQVEVSGKVEKMNHPLLHYTYRDISNHLLKMDRYTTLAAQQNFQEGNRARIWDLTLRPGFKFINMYLLRGGFLEGRAGLVIALLGSFYVFLKYAKLWELNAGKVTGPEA